MTYLDLAAHGGRGSPPKTARRCREPKSGGFGGGLRDRLRVEFADGGVELFVVNELDEVAEHLSAAVAGGAVPAPAGAVTPPPTASFEVPQAGEPVRGRAPGCGFARLRPPQPRPAGRRSG